LPHSPPLAGRRIFAAMNFRTYHRIHRVPSTILFVCLITFSAVLSIGQVAEFLRDQSKLLPMIVLAGTAIGPVLFVFWYLTCYAAVRRSTLRVKWFWRTQTINLRRLEQAEVLATGRGERSLVMRLEESDGTQLWLPLTTWRDEDLLMARVLRATVDCRVRIEGDPMLVRRFARVLDTYKSWDRQLAA
jgi:hypothetical protein